MKNIKDIAHHIICLLINQYGSLKYLSPIETEELDIIIRPIIDNIKVKINRK
ncbi:unnamed protein product [marine sediment metagenome]|uniref:Uncharacterized protein n=1 Tax=marine sediment metagenome TaxID=412755 RepID=X1KIP7_9ZZZZ